jgi:hypothetical protein
MLLTLQYVIDQIFAAEYSKLLALFRNEPLPPPKGFLLRPITPNGQTQNTGKLESTLKLAAHP